ncbi:MAG: hypothetical protein KC613_06670 [Myxococcales bacterium]|nr:hypothetical protein [Myxococcales bacterium]MCB9525091.1 hypothetical protein [Myxococcales bacterium]
MYRALPTILALLTGCAFDAHREDEYCGPAAFCEPGYVCSANNLCEPQAPDAAPMDEGSTTDATRDARPTPARDEGLPLDQEAAEDQAPLIDQAPAPDRAPPDMALPLPLPPNDPDFRGVCGLDTRCFQVDEDGYIEERWPTRALPAQPDLQVDQSRNGDDRIWTLLRFDLTPWRDHRWPSGCDLVLRRRGRPNDQPSSRLQVERVEANPGGVDGWPATLSWERRPARRSAALHVPFDATGPGGQQRVDVGAFLPDVRAEGSLAIAFVLKYNPLEEGEPIAYDSRDAQEPEASAPFLECRYFSP